MYVMYICVYISATSTHVLGMPFVLTHHVIPDALCNLPCHTL